MASNGDVAADGESVEVIDKLVDDPTTANLVRAFYDRECADELSGGKADFIGELFTSLGDTPANSFEADDLLAVHLMGMRFSVSATEALLGCEAERKDVSACLAKIPVDRDIWEDEANLSDDSPASELWELLVGKAYPGIGWVTAGKLLARKRPQLIPVIDNVITKRVGLPDNHYWLLFQGYLRSNEHRDKVDSLRPDGVPASLPTLRLLDTAIWMHGSMGPAKVIREKLADQLEEPSLT